MATSVDDGNEDSNAANDDPVAIAADGRILLCAHLRDDLWRGYEAGPRPRSIVILAIDRYGIAREDLEAMLGFDVPGIAPLVFAGYADPEPNSGGARPPLLIVEARPDGTPLVDAATLSEGEVVRLGIALCDTIIGWAARCESLTAGLRPENVYVAGPPGARYYAGATPRVFLLTGDNEAGDAQVYVSPFAPSIFTTSLVDATFMVAQVLWFAATREHAYLLEERPNGSWNMEEDRKRPYTGNPEIGALLDRVLVYDEDKRIDVDALRAGLVALAQRWGVELPPLPPPGLAD